MNKSSFEEISTSPGVIRRLNSLAQGRRLIKADIFSAQDQQLSTQEQPLQQDAELEFRKKGEFVDMIKVNCSCGKTTEILLDYDGDAPPKTGRKSPSSHSD